MVTHTLGSGPRTAVLLHGGGLSWWNYRAVADLLAANGYRVVLPVLDGHAGSDRPFTSIEDNASELVAFIDRELGGRVDALGGVSLGAQVALDALAQRPLIAGRAVVNVNPSFTDSTNAIAPIAPTHPRRFRRRQAPFPASRSGARSFVR